ncbi:MAG: hypothetical protein ABH951_01925 [Patescibacteria group bacterium]
MAQKKVEVEYYIGGTTMKRCLIAIVEDGKVIACPEIKISEEQNNGLTIDEAIEFLNNIKRAKEETLDEKVASIYGFNSTALKNEIKRQEGHSLNNPARR